MKKIKLTGEIPTSALKIGYRTPISRPAGEPKYFTGLAPGGRSGKKVGEEGSGRGGGVAFTPVGYIEIRNGEICFRPIRDWLTVLPAIATTVPTVLPGVWGLNNYSNQNNGGN